MEKAWPGEQAMFEDTRDLAFELEWKRTVLAEPLQMLLPVVPERE
jgi:hypothetical protein